MSKNNPFLSPSLTKEMKRLCLTPEQMFELREFIYELDLVPLGVIPLEMHKLLYDYQHDIRNEDKPFDDITNIFIKDLNTRLRERAKLRKQQEDEQFKLL